MMLFALKNLGRVRFWLVFGTLVAGLGMSMPVRAQVVFDISPIAPARAAEHYGLMARMPNSRFVEVSLETSALFQAGTSSVISEVTVHVLSRHEEVIVADFSPRTEMHTDILGPMQVAADNEAFREAGLQGLGGYPGAGSVSGFAYQMEGGHQSIQYSKKPTMDMLMASGTFSRHRGVYFKMRQSSQMTLEGARQFRIVFEVPENWRADLLDVRIEAVGTENTKSRRSVLLSSQPFVVAVYQEGDEVAARVAANYRKQHAGLVQVTRNYAWAIEHRSFPTPFHKLGAKLDIYQPDIPQGWFEAIVYQPGIAYHVSKLSRLPVDVRVAVMNFLDQKTRIESLSDAKNTSAGSPGSQIAQSDDSSEFARR
jgi:hypothetical protein